MLSHADVYERISSRQCNVDGGIQSKIRRNWQLWEDGVGSVVGTVQCKFKRVPSSSIIPNDIWKQSVCDLPAIAFSPELMAAYPSAKVILTTREANSWHKSMSKSLLQARWYWMHEVLQYFDWITALVHPLRKKYWQCLFEDDFETNGKAAMQDHYAEVRNIARNEGRDILEMGLSDGWDPLCNYLQVDTPSFPYPRMNDGENWTLKMKERARLRAKAAAIRFAKIALPLTVAGFGLWAIAVILKTKRGWSARSLLERWM